MFRLSSLGHHQGVSLYRGNYKVYGMIQYVNIKIITIQRDLVFSVNASNNMFFFVSIEQREIVKLVI